MSARFSFGSPDRTGGCQPPSSLAPRAAAKRRDERRRERDGGEGLADRDRTAVSGLVPRSAAVVREPGGGPSSPAMTITSSSCGRRLHPSRRDGRRADALRRHGGQINSSPNEAGLLGVAFHPSFADERLVSLSYTKPSATSPANLRSVIARAKSNDGGLTLDSRRSWS